MLDLIYNVIVYLFLVYIFLIFLLNLSQKSDVNIVSITHKHYYFLVPCVNEEQVIRNTIQALLDIDEQCIIVAIDDGSSDDTYLVMQEFVEDRLIILKRELPNAQQGKGVALNDALKLCINDAAEKNLDFNQVIVGVVDADGRLSRNSITELDSVFSDENISAAQMRVKMYDDFKNTLQVSQDLEFFTVNNLTQKARRTTHSVGLSGNGQFFRLLPILNEIGDEPWGTSLLDDYELTLKLMIKGLKIDYIYKAYVYQEALMSTSRFIKQRSRWIQGNLDCLKYIKLVRNSIVLTKWQKCSIYYFLSQPFLNLIADICIILLTIRFMNQTYSLLPMIYVNFNEYVFLCLGIVGISLFFGTFFTLIYLENLSQHNEIKPDMQFIIKLPIIASYMYVILFFSVMMAFWRYLTNQHEWIKTKRN